jgi:DnaA family protein
LTQLVLDLAPPPAPTLDNFVTGSNLEALAVLRALAPGGVQACARFIYFWGVPGSGRTHLLRGLQAAEPTARWRFLGPASDEEQFIHDPDVRGWLIDDCDQLDRPRQEAAFHLFNAVQAQPHSCLVAAGAEPPARLPVMPELATRLGWGLVLQLTPLSDADTATALAQTFAERGVAASPELIPWLMTHAPRNLGRLRALIDALDTYALSRKKRVVTLPLLRAFLQQNRPADQAASGSAGKGTGTTDQPR